MPWLAPHQAPLGLAIVGNSLRRAGISTKILHPNIDFYLRLCEKFSPAAADSCYSRGEAGEVIAGSLFRRRTPPDGGHGRFRAYLREAGFSPKLFRAVAKEFDAFTEEWLSSFDWRTISACGFGLAIYQNMTSLYWARKIRERAPWVALAAGGSQCSDPMGLELFRSMPFLDAVARGECDASIVPLFQALRNGNTEMLEHVPNLACRRGEEILITRSEPARLEDAVPPDYSDFERAYHRVEELTGRPANYYIEGSRGCWWGQKHHCSFCGIHTSGMAFREKETDVVYGEIVELLERRRAIRFAFADTILSVRNLKKLVPKLEELGRNVDIEFLADVKPNLRKETVYALARAGCIVMQVGIESLSDRLLRKLEKGNTALQHVQTLKWCTEAGIVPYYHILTHVIGETPEDLRQMLALMRGMVHIHPPSGVFPIELNRYAPYFENWQELGFEKPEPALFYRLMFSPGEIDLERFAYHFEGVHPSTRTPQLDAARRTVAEFVEKEWIPGYENEFVHYWAGRDFVRLFREGTLRRRQVLEGPEAELYLECDRVRHVEALKREFRPRLAPDRIEKLIDELCQDGFMARAADGVHVLSLAIRKLRLRPSLEDRNSPKSEAGEAEELVPLTVKGGAWQ